MQGGRERGGKRGRQEGRERGRRGKRGREGEREREREEKEGEKDDHERRGVGSKSVTHGLDAIRPALHAHAYHRHLHRGQRNNKKGGRGEEGGRAAVVRCTRGWGAQ